MAGKTAEGLDARNRDLRREIEELRRQQESLRRLAARYQAILVAAPDIIAEVDTAKRYVWLNSAGFVFFGDDALGREAAEFFIEEQPTYEAVGPLFDGDEDVVYLESWQRRRDGERRLLAWWCRVLKDADGRVTGALSTGRDITDQREADTRLRASQERLRAVVQNMPVMMAAFNAEGGIVAWNRECERVTGYSVAEIAKNPRALDLLYPDEAHRRKVREAMSERGLDFCGQEWQVTCKDGTVRTAAWSNISKSFPIPGWAAWAVGVDITDRERAAEEQRRLDAHLQQAQKYESLGILAGGIAHDFNNLLVAVLGNADLALRNVAPASPAKPNIEAIRTAAVRASELTNQLLAYSGKGKFLTEMFDLSDLVTEMGGLLKVSVSRNVALRLDLADDLPPIVADAAQVRQVVVNLLMNASEAVGDGPGTITVSTRAAGADACEPDAAFPGDGLPEGVYARLDVADTGSGIREEDRAKLFDPFFTTKFTGRGLGLAAVLGIVRGHGGTVRLSSKVGVGSTFTVLLPGASAARAGLTKGAARRSRDCPWQGTGTVLVVDDEEGVREVAAHMLERLGFTVIPAADGQEAVAAFRRHVDDIVLVLLDMTMPKMSGKDALHEMRRIRPDVKVVLCSGYGEQDATSHFATRDLAGFVQKPFGLADLSYVVRHALASDPQERNSRSEGGEPPTP